MTSVTRSISFVWGCKCFSASLSYCKTFWIESSISSGRVEAVITVIVGEVFIFISFVPGVINLNIDFMFYDEADKCQISNHFHSLKILKILIKVISALDAVKILLVPEEAQEALEMLLMSRQ